MLPIYGLLDEAKLRHLKDRLGQAEFRDGRETAGPVARRVKANEQAALDEDADALQAYVRDALMANADFRLFARPARWSVMLFSRYRAGHHYGRHYDNWDKPASDGARMRSDLSFTLFLGEPSEYEGGELALERPEGPVTIKLPAGAAFIYSTGVIHQVLPVRSGERLVCVGWIQSMIRNDERRALLYDLDRVLAAMNPGEPRLILDKSIGALLRMWAER